jgi:hypothetical protein
MMLPHIAGIACHEANPAMAVEVADHVGPSEIAGLLD